MGEVLMSTSTWHQSEWDEQTLVAYSCGYELSVSPEIGTDAWFWAVRVTSEISEWPEVYAAGFVHTLTQAQHAADMAFSRAIARS
jgi:hypothetical protein